MEHSVFTPADQTLPAIDGTARGDPGCDVTAVGRYAVVGELGRGGMGVVYQAYHPLLARYVALKMLHRHAPDPSARLRFGREVELAARLSHPGIVTVYEAGDADGCPYFVMELIDGPTLAEHLRVRGPLPPGEAARLVLRLARAVAHAHDHGVLHRDLKPSNVLLDSAGEPHVTDFGLARPLGRGGDGGSSAALSELGVVVGTPAYMAPEQARGQADIGPAADVWSLGAILYECLTGRPPFQGRSALAILRQVEQDDPPSPRALVPEVPPELEAVCLACLRKDPAERYATVAELADDLERFLDGEGVRCYRPSWSGRVARLLAAHHLSPRHRAWARLVLVLGAVVLLTQAALAALVVWPPAGFRYAALAVHVLQVGFLALAFHLARPAEIGQAPAERQLAAIWGGFLGAAVLCCVASGDHLGPAGPEEELRIYPHLAGLSAFALLVTGAGYCGCCYVGAGAFGLLALAGRPLGLAIVPAFGVAWAATLLLLSWRLCRLAPER